MKRLFLALIIMTSSSYAGSIQKWTDETGNVHYGDNPPARVKAKTVDVLRPPSNPGKPLPRLGDTKATSNKTTPVSNNGTPEKPPKTSAEKNAKACAAARKNLDIINRSDIVRLRMPDGTERILSDEEVNQRRTRYQQNIKSYCQ